MESPNASPPSTGSPWNRIANEADFQSLLRAKARFIITATVFFLVYYFALPILTGYWPELMARKVFGHFSLAYIFALTQFPMAWILAALYLRAAARFDRDAARLVARHTTHPASPDTPPHASASPETHQP